MESTFHNTIIDVLLRFMAQVRANMDILNINASHRTEKSLRLVQNAAGFQVIMGGDGTAPVESLETGRPPGKVPSNFIDIIYQWMGDKGIPQDRDVAGAIAYSIKKHGTLRFQRLMYEGRFESVYSLEAAEVQKQIENGIGAFLAERRTQIYSNL